MLKQQFTLQKDVQNFFNGVGVPSLHYALERTGQTDTLALHERERLALGEVSEHRLSEFTLGRSVAKKAVASVLGLHVLDVFILRASSGVPIWPERLTGSISHTDNLALAVCAKACKTIGVDIQVIRPVNVKLKNKLLSEHECLLDWGGSEQSALLQLFSIKESIYKAVFGLWNYGLNARDIVVVPKVNEHFSCDVVNPKSGQCIHLTGRYACYSNVVMSLAYCMA